MINKKENGPIIINYKWSYILFKYKNKLIEFGTPQKSRADVILWFNGYNKRQ